MPYKLSNVTNSISPIGSMYFITVETLQQVEKTALENAKQTILKETYKLISTIDCWEFSLNCMRKG